MILPRDFIKILQGFPIPEVVYEGNFNKEFIFEIRQNGIGEGVVVKGVNPKSKKEQHGLWMSKVKTNAWLNKLKSLALTNDFYQKVLSDNLKEQDYE